MRGYQSFHETVKIDGKIVFEFPEALACHPVDIDPLVLYDMASVGLAQGDGLEVVLRVVVGGLEYHAGQSVQLPRACVDGYEVCIPDGPGASPEGGNP